MKHNIDHILNKYWEGGSTLDEEMELKVYFRGNNIDAAHEPYKELFDFFGNQADVKYPQKSMQLNIDILLDKYWEGNTSVEDENLLKDYFSGTNIIDEHKPYQELFRYFTEQQNITYQTLNIKKGISEGKSKVIVFRKFIYAVAAVSVLVFAAVSVMKNIEPKQVIQETSLVNEIDDPEEALRVTKEALAMVSKKFRASQQTVRKNMGSLEKAAIFK